MSELVYLGMALLVSLIGSAVVWFRQRRPQSLEGGVEEFARGLAALTTDAPLPGQRRVPRRRLF